MSASRQKDTRGQRNFNIRGLSTYFLLCPLSQIFDRHRSVIYHFRCFSDYVKVFLISTREKPLLRLQAAGGVSNTSLLVGRSNQKVGTTKSILSNRNRLKDFPVFAFERHGVSTGRLAGERICLPCGRLESRYLAAIRREYEDTIHVVGIVERERF